LLGEIEPNFNKYFNKFVYSNFNENSIFKRCPPTCADYASHAAFVSATGLDAAPPSIVVDNTATNPFFVNEAGGDYNLLSTSPAQSAGAALPADIAAALAVPVSPVDMGLFFVATDVANLRMPNAY
jgi:hypothetical protein